MKPPLTWKDRLPGLVAVVGAVLLLGTFAIFVSPSTLIPDKYAHLKDLTRITPQVIPQQYPRAGSNPPDGPHGTNPNHVYVNPIVLNWRVMNPNASHWPVGSVFVIEHFEPDDIALTVMRRIGEQGAVDDWEFKAIDLPSMKEFEGGRFSTCKECHEQFADRDYVSPETVARLDLFLAESDKP